jgi:hypothetical protein
MGRAFRKTSGKRAKKGEYSRKNSKNTEKLSFFA